MSDLLLAKPVLPHGVIDCSVGEPHVLRKNLFSIFSLDEYVLPQPKHCWEYPAPNGFKPLVQLLESQYKAPVIITNGAKQALGASFYALKRMGKTNIGMRNPYWALIPPLVEMHGMKCQDSYLGADSYLLLLPNNPDGFAPDYSFIRDFEYQAKEQNIPLIHDAAYFTHSYLPGDYPLHSIGDVQIYSISKMLGLSGLRLGYAVCKNPEFYRYFQEYMESMTVGVSIVSQIFLYDLLRRMQSYPTLKEKFENISAMDLEESKKIMQKVSPEILKVPRNIKRHFGMFGWYKVGEKADFKKAKVYLLDGALFGVPGYVRMNLAFKKDIMLEIVKRLNGSLEGNV